ncbi:MAG: hypothetical protein Q9207_004998 [Kuettlingeria erythrocarpa]
MILLPVASAVWLVVGGLFTWYYPGVMWNTLSAVGEETVRAGWKNPFATKSILELADWFVALQADIIFPHILPGATSTGRPYIVDHATYFANVTSEQATKASLQGPFSQQNVTYPAVLSGFNHAAPAGHVIDAAAWYGSLAGCFALVLVLVLLAWKNQSVRHANGALSAAASQLDCFFSGLLKVTSRSDPNMNKRLHEFLQVAQQQGWIPDPYQLDLMAHVELIIGLNGQVTLLKFRNGDISNKYDAALGEVLNLRQALATYQYRYERRDREATYLDVSVDRLEAALASQTQSHSAKVNQLAEDHKTAESINTQKLTKHYEEKIKTLQDKHTGDMDRQARQLREEGSQKEQLRDKLDIVQEMLRNAEDRLALALPTSGDTDPGAPADALHNPTQEEVHPIVPDDQPVKVKKPTRGRTKAQVAASKRRQALEKEANGEREATGNPATASTGGQKPVVPESSSQQNELGPAQTSDAGPQSDTPPHASTHLPLPNPVDTSVPSLSNVPTPDPGDLTPAPDPAFTPPSGPLTQMETPPTGLDNDEQQEVTRGKRYNENARRKLNRKAKKSAEKEQVEAGGSTADKKDQAQIESQSTPAPGPFSPSAPASPVVPSVEKGSTRSNEENDLDNSKVHDNGKVNDNSKVDDSSSHSNESTDSGAQTEQTPASIDTKKPEPATDQPSSSSAPVEEHSGSKAAGSVAEPPASPSSATSQEQQTSDDAVPSSTQPSPPSSSSSRSEGQEVNGDGSGQEEPKSPSRKSVPLSKAEKAEKEKAEDEEIAKKKAELEKAELEKAKLEQAKKALAEKEAQEEQAKRAEEARVEKQLAEKERARREEAQKAEKAEAEKAQKELAEKALAEKAQKELAEKEQLQKEKAQKALADKEQAQKALAEKEQADKDQAEKKKQQAERRTANSNPVPTGQSSSAASPSGDRRPPTSTTTPASANQQRFTQPPTRRERERLNNGGQLPPWLNPRTPRGTDGTPNDSGAAIRRQYERQMAPGSGDGPSDGPGESSAAEPPTKPFVPPRPRSPGKNKRRGQGNRNRRGEHHPWGSGDRGFGGSGVWGI